MTEKEIIKALKHCYEHKSCNDCVGCLGAEECILNADPAGDIYPIINRQQAENNRQKAEIEKLQLSRKQKLKEIERLKKGWKADVIETQNIKAEAIKEYKEKLREHAYLDSGITGFQEMVVDLSDIENIAEEMVGEGK